MTKEERIQELVKSRIREARLKKGYEGKGADVDKTVTIVKLHFPTFVNIIFMYFLN